MGKLNNSLGTHMVTKEVVIGYMCSHNDISITYRYRKCPLGHFPISIMCKNYSCHLSMNNVLTKRIRLGKLKNNQEVVHG